MATLEKIHILKFRNLSDQYFSPDSAINLILGKNGQGKTNLIESLYYLGHGRSFKTKNLKDIIPFDDDQIQIDIIVAVIFSQIVTTIQEMNDSFEFYDSGNRRNIIESL